MKINRFMIAAPKSGSGKTMITCALLQLLKDSAMLDQLYDLNKVYFRELTMYILAGKKKLEKETNEVLPALRKKAQETGSQEDAQEVNDREALCNRFEKKIHDLELTRMVSLQMAPQIRMLVTLQCLRRFSLLL